jgi:hypothetical protein
MATWTPLVARSVVCCCTPSHAGTQRCSHACTGASNSRACAQAQQRLPDGGAAPREQPDALEADRERRARADRRLKRLHEQQEAARRLASNGAPGLLINTPGQYETLQRAGRTAMLEPKLQPCGIHWLQLSGGQGCAIDGNCYR